MFEIKILGIKSCKNCSALKTSFEEVLKENNINGSVEKLSDPKKFLEYGLLSSPGILINGKLVSSGKLPSKEEMKRLLNI